jgi:protein-S-isoprenylcysteine O-methyltransferase Ste14
MTTFTITFVIWALLHSLTADRRVKDWVKQRVGERPYQGFYRLFYNIFALVTFLPVLAAVFNLPRTPIWNIPAPGSYGLNLVQLIGVVGLGIAAYQTDFWDFVGLRQAVRYLQGKKEINLPPNLVTNGMYAFVRHPLYFFSLLVIWAIPMMNLHILIFNFFATMYFWAGSRVEERRLAEYFGSAYETYRSKVPGILPIRLPGRLKSSD